MAKNSIPKWILQCLEQYGNCACGRDITKKLGKEKLLGTLESLGHPCDLEIINNPNNEEFPKEGTYILVSKNREILLDSADNE